MVIYADCRKLALYAECHYAECRYAECCVAIFYVVFAQDSGGSTVVEHLPRHPKVKGSSSAAASGIGRKKMGKSVSTHANMQ
jgi:hypothetical protein